MIARRRVRLLLLAALALAAVFLPTVGARAQDEGPTAPPPDAAAEAAADAGPDDAEAGEDAGEDAGEEEEAPDPAGERVAVGAYINDIQVVDLKTHSYEMDVYVWFRWKAPAFDPMLTVEVVNPNELWGHMVLPAYEESEELESGELYQVVRYQGRFSRKMPLYDYPFDRQSLVVLLEDTRWNTEALRFVPDAAPITLNPKLSLPGYDIGEPSLTVVDTTYPTAFGDPRLGAPDQYSRLSIEVPITRPKVAYSLKLFLPVVCVILCATLMFLLSAAYVDSRVDVGITSLLTIVALQMTFNQDVPDVGYLMLMDKVYICSYLFVIAGLLVVVRTTRMSEAGEVAGAARLHARALAGLLSLYLLAVTGLVLGAMA
jgi:hypothetical protein